VHKIVTGRQKGFDLLRQRGGVSGYPARAESEHDFVENSHASTALSYADGLSKAFELRGEQRCVVAVVGDGALTGGMCWERSEEHTSELQSRENLVCRLLLEKKNETHAAT